MGNRLNALLNDQQRKSPLADLASDPTGENMGVNVQPMPENYIQNSRTGNVTSLDQYAQPNALQRQLQPALDYASGPVEMNGMKGYRVAGDPFTVMMPNGTKLSLGNDYEATRKRNMEDIEMAKAKADVAVKNEQAKQLASDKFQITGNGDIFDKTTGKIVQMDATPTAMLKAQKTAAYNAGLKDLGKDDAQVAQAQALEDAYKRWMELNARTTTGPIAGRRPISFDTDYQEMKQLENYLSMNNFKPGQGQMSNMERKLISGAGPNTTNSLEANQDIAKIGLGAAQNMKDRANFREQYLNARGNLLGSDQAWQEYLEKNPRFIKDASGRVVDNPARQDWMAYFGSQAVPTAIPSPGIQAGAMPSGPSQSDLEFTAKKYGITVDQVKQRLGVK